MNKTKDKIFKSALKLFSKQGIGRTSTAQISEDAGVASGTLFVHFKTKQDLIDSLYASIKRDAFADLMEKIDLNDSVEKNVKAITERAIEYFIKNYREFIFMELVENDPQVSERAIAVAKKEYVEISKLTEEWKKIGALRDMDAEVLHQAMWGICCAVIRHCKKNKLAEVDDVYLDMIWAAVRK